MILSVEGDEATGKSTVAYTAPYPIVGFSFDLGAERAIFGTQFEKHFDKLRVDIVKYDNKADAEALYNKQTADIVIFRLPQPIQLETTKIVGCSELWDYFIKLFSMALMDTRIETIVIDTMTLARRLKADAYLQEQQKGRADRKQLLQIEWGHPNDAIRNLYTICAGMDKNLVALHHLTDERKDVPGAGGTVESMMTGNRVLEGLSQTYRYVDVALRMHKRRGQLFGELKKSGPNMHLEGNEIPDPTWNLIFGMISMSLGGRLEMPMRASND